MLLESLLVKEGDIFVLVLGVDGTARDEFCGVIGDWMVLFPVGFFSRFLFFVTLERRGKTSDEKTHSFRLHVQQKCTRYHGDKILETLRGVFGGSKYFFHKRRVFRSSTSMLIYD